MSKKDNTKIIRSLTYNNAQSLLTQIKNPPSNNSTNNASKKEK